MGESLGESVRSRPRSSFVLHHDGSLRRARGLAVALLSAWFGCGCHSLVGLLILAVTGFLGGNLQ